jgi:hypothetical protein
MFAQMYYTTGCNNNPSVPELCTNAILALCCMIQNYGYYKEYISFRDMLQTAIKNTTE